MFTVPPRTSSDARCRIRSPTILTVALLLRHFLGPEWEARAVESAVDAALEDGCMTPDITTPGTHPRRTTDVGGAVAERVLAS